MSDLGSHWVDLPFWALKLKYPKTIEPFGGPAHKELAPASMHVRYEYAAMGDQPEVALTWYQGTHKPEILSRGDVPAWDSGVLFVGDKGMLLSDYGKHCCCRKISSRTLNVLNHSFRNRSGIIRNGFMPARPVIRRRATLSTQVG
jgi:hypothetical protein